MLLVAALYLPFSLEFESEQHLSTEPPVEEEEDARRVPLIRPPPPQTAELVPQRTNSLQVPFDFVNTPRKSGRDSPSPPPAGTTSGSGGKLLVEPRRSRPAKESVMVNTVVPPSYLQRKKPAPEQLDTSLHPPPQQKVERDGDGVGHRLAAAKSSVGASGIGGGRTAGLSLAERVNRADKSTASELVAGSAPKMPAAPEARGRPTSLANSTPGSPTARRRTSSSTVLSSASPSPSGTPRRALSKPRARRKTISQGGFDRVQRSYCIVPQPAGNGGLYNAMSRAVASDIIEQPRWVGLLGVPTDAIGPKGRSRTASLLDQRGCTTVYVSDAEYAGHYLEYCKEFLWPTFHGLTPDVPKARAYEENSWGSYSAVNQAVADALVANYNPGDTIWVHDYHLMLVPAMVRQKLPDARIGFFMHIAFPTSEVFRCLAYRAELLKGILAANFVGFQNQEYTQHFLMTAARILALDTSPTHVHTPDRDVRVVDCPIGIDPERLDNILQSEAVQKHRQIIRDRWPTAKIIGARDKVDGIKGLRHKLQAFGMFLTAHPELASSVVLIQVLTSTPGSEIEAELATLAENINSKYDITAGIQPVVLLRQDIVFDQYIALISEADAFAVTSLREGMNLTCHEFIYCNDDSRCGPVVLSEFTGSASVLGDDALLVNPWDKKRLAEAFYDAVVMDEVERQERRDALKQTVQRHTCETWVSVLADELEAAYRDDQLRQTRKPNQPAIAMAYRDVHETGKRMVIFDIPTQARQSDARLEAQVRTQTELLPVRDLSCRRKSASLDKEQAGPIEQAPDQQAAQLLGLGAHSPVHVHVSNDSQYLTPPRAPNFVRSLSRDSVISRKQAETTARPPVNNTAPYYASRLIFVLHRLLNDSRNIVYVASNESRAYMERVFRQLPGIGLIAESGKYVRYTGTTDWTEIGVQLDREWQGDIQPVLEKMRERLPLQEIRKHESTIEVDFLPPSSDIDEERLLATVGEFISVIDDSFSKHGVRCHLEGLRLSMYTSQIMSLQARVQQEIFEHHEGTLDFVLAGHQQVAADIDEVIHTYLDALHFGGKIRKLVTLVLGKHHTLAQSSIEGINALLTLLESISEK